MKIPYNCLEVRGGQIFAARGGFLFIQSFSTSGAPILSSWTHPDVEKQRLAAKTNPPRDLDVQGLIADDASVTNSPPPKKPRVRESVGGSEEVFQEAGQKTENNKRKHAHRHAVAPPVNRPLIAHMAVSSDGRLVALVSGHDKTVWVIEHDGQGNVRELSRRPMPKRPSSIALSPDETLILCPDKFGDVYALPLLVPTDVTSWPSPNAPVSLVVKHESKGPAATTFTVHSQTNLRGLEAQKRQHEAKKAGKVPHKGTPKSEVPDFNHALILGHVSMLTALLVGRHAGHYFIITADRDEHIRVSRYIPHAYIIENFCLGHSEFIASLCIPQGRENILLSAGGDDDIFVWDWPTAKLVSKGNILSHAQSVVPGLQNVSVSQILTQRHPDGEGVNVFVICEGIPALFTFHLPDTQTALVSPRTISLPSNPLAIAFHDQISATISLDPSSAAAPSQGSVVGPQQFFFGLTFDPESGWQPTESSRTKLLDSVPADPALDVSGADEVRRLLYTIGNLRKNITGSERDEDDGDN